MTKPSPRAASSRKKDPTPKAAPTRQGVSRRRILTTGAKTAAVASTFGLLEKLSIAPIRARDGGSGSGSSGSGSGGSGSGSDGSGSGGSGSSGSGAGGSTPPSASTMPSDIQYDIGAFVPPPLQFRGIAFGLGGPSHTRFVTARLTRTPTKSDQMVLASALAKIESSYAWSPTG